eukprot:SAG31_NODE_1966_length_6786_cov_7.109167_4_plen_175_part_00
MIIAERGAGRSGQAGRRHERHGVRGYPSLDLPSVAHGRAHAGWRSSAGLSPNVLRSLLEDGVQPPTTRAPSGVPVRLWSRARSSASTADVGLQECSKSHPQRSDRMLRPLSTPLRRACTPEPGLIYASAGADCAHCQRRGNNGRRRNLQPASGALSRQEQVNPYPTALVCICCG